MNRFWKPLIAAAICAVPLFFTDHNVIAADNPNTAEVTKVQITPTLSTVTLKLTVNDSAQPVLVQVAGSNDTANVETSIELVGGADGDIIQVKLIPAAKAGDPHTLEITPPKKDAVISLIDKSWTAVPQYLVKTEGGVTTVHVGLLIRNGSPKSVSQAVISFQGGGIIWTSKAVQLDAGKDGIVSDVVNPVPASDKKPLLPLGYWASVGDFKDVAPEGDSKNPAATKIKKGKADAFRKFPMKGNWPAAYTLPGPIHFELETVKLPPFDLTGTALAQKTQFDAEVASDAHLFPEGKIDVESNSVFGKVDVSKWPLIEYEETITYSTAPPGSALVQVDSKRFINTKKTDDPYKKPGKVVLNVSPGQENSDFLKGLLASVQKLPDDESISDVIKVLNQVIPLALLQEKRRDELQRIHQTLVQTGAAAEVISKSRYQLESAKAAVSSLFENFNDWMRTYPK